MNTERVIPHESTHTGIWNVRAVRHTAVLYAVLTAFIGTGRAQHSTPIVRDIDIRGDASLGSRRILQGLGMHTGKRLPRDFPDPQVESLLQSAYREGYFRFRVDSLRTDWNADSTSVRLTVWVDEGRRFQTESITLKGPDSLLNRILLAGMQTRSGRTFDPAVLREDIESSLDYLENQALPLSRIAVDSVNVFPADAHTGIGLALLLDTGPRVRYGSIRARGNTLTRESVIVRETRLRSGAPYDQADIRRARENLIRLNFFDQVAPPEIRFVDNEAYVTFLVTEGRANTFEGVVGYVPAETEEEKGYFTGRLDLSFRNLFGTGRLLKVYWEKKDRLSQSMILGAEEPWLFGRPVFAGGRFAQEIRDSTYIERNWRLTVRWVPWSTLSLSVEGGQRSILPDSLSSARLGLARTRTWVLSGRIDFDNLNDPVNPRKGVHYHTLVTTGRKQFIGPDFLADQIGWKDVRRTRQIEVDAEFFIPLFRNQVLYTGLHGVEVKSGEPATPVTEQIRIGGATTLRGYVEDVFRGDLAAWFNFEYRYLLGRRSRAFLFLDGGMIQRREQEAGLIRQDKFGYGFGIRLETRLGLMGVDYGLGEGDGLMQGKIHVGVTSSF